MSAAKWSFIITGVLAVTTFFVFLLPFPPLFDKADDVLLAVFGSAFLASIIALIEYFNTRRFCMEDFIQRSDDVIHSFRTAQYFVEGMDIRECAQSYSLISDREMRDLGNAYARLDFLFANRTLKKRAYKDIYSPLHKAYLAAIEKRWHFSNGYNTEAWRRDLLDLNRTLHREKACGAWDDVVNSIDAFNGKIKIIRFGRKD